MEIPVLVVVQVVNAQGGAHLLADLPAQAHVGGEVLAGAHVGKAVDVAVVQAGKLAAAVARAQGAGPVRVKAVADQRRGPPDRHARLVFAQRVAGRGDKAAVVLDARVGIGCAAVEVQPPCQHIGAVEGHFHAVGLDAADVLHPADVQVGDRIKSGLRIQGVAHVLGEQREAQQGIAQVFFSGQLAGPGFFRLQVRVVEVAGIDRRGGTIQLAHSRKAHRPAG